ncbi:protein transport protein Sec61 subunit gamma-like [Drosophila willistoni]|uniref:protein transport protein Sec61 subunit gamma-like n=1 Tax=Drosophila willistoni TaxID=7260 RepID=UPI000C26CB09|nr:protein transport protein Sec61 subunit gamma-like [Drosophila willistoni]
MTFDIFYKKIEEQIARRRGTPKSSKSGWLKHTFNVITSNLLNSVPSVCSIKESFRFLQQCTKPNRYEFFHSSMATAIGFLIMGSFGCAVKLIHIPIQNILMG